MGELLEVAAQEGAQRFMLLNFIQILDLLWRVLEAGFQLYDCTCTRVYMYSAFKLVIVSCI